MSEAEQTRAAAGESAENIAFARVTKARHPERPYANDYIARLCEDFRELHGDRRYSDDPAVICGWGRFETTPVLLIGQQKGRDTKQRQHRNFGMSLPEGYRKALRAMKLAEKFGRAIITLIDTPGAYPGIEAEERGQAEAIAFNLREMYKLRVPLISVIIGEGGSGGALAIGVGDHVIMLENSVYSVITPEGCAAILWKSAAAAPRAAEQLKLTARDLTELRIVDEIVPEPEEGAHRDWEAATEHLRNALRNALADLSARAPAELAARRYARLRGLGVWGSL